MSQRENASSPLKLQPPIYYVYVYKSLRRPHIPKACKKRRRERKERKLGRRGWTGKGGTEVKMCEEWRVFRTRSWSQRHVSLFHILNDDDMMMDIFGEFKRGLFSFVACVYRFSLISYFTFINTQLSEKSKDVFTQKRKKMTIVTSSQRHADGKSSRVS